MDLLIFRQTDRKANRERHTIGYQISWLEGSIRSNILRKIERQMETNLKRGERNR